MGDLQYGQTTFLHGLHHQVFLIVNDTGCNIDAARLQLGQITGVNGTSTSARMFATTIS